MRSDFLRRLVAVAVVVMAAQVLTPPAGADHSWEGYHWARTANPFTLTLVDNVSPAWDPYLVTTSADWTASVLLDTNVVGGTTLNSQLCNPVYGRVEVCSYDYGRTGWLGIAEVWVIGSHIVRGTVKMNDRYFNMPGYNSPAWRNSVMCQEVGHTLGLDHQDEVHSNANLNTCTDYSNNPTSNQHPNAHDYAQLESIYAHRDSSNSASASAPTASAGADRLGQEDLGEPLRYGRDGRPVLFVRDLPGQDKHFTWVTWAE